MVKSCCIKLVREFWKDGKLMEKVESGIVKLVPKRVDLLEYLTNWRLLTMLTMTYKNVSKILVERLKPKLPCQVDLQQTGFI